MHSHTDTLQGDVIKMRVWGRIDAGVNSLSQIYIVRIYSDINANDITIIINNRTTCIRSNEKMISSPASSLTTLVTQLMNTTLIYTNVNASMKHSFPIFNALHRTYVNIIDADDL